MEEILQREREVFLKAFRQIKEESQLKKEEARLKREEEARPKKEEEAKQEKEVARQKQKKDMKKRALQRLNIASLQLLVLTTIAIFVACFAFLILSKVETNDSSTYSLPKGAMVLLGITVTLESVGLLMGLALLLVITGAGTNQPDFIQLPFDSLIIVTVSGVCTFWAAFAVILWDQSSILGIVLIVLFGLSFISILLVFLYGNYATFRRWKAILAARLSRRRYTVWIIPESKAMPCRKQRGSTSVLMTMGLENEPNTIDIGNWKIYESVPHQPPNEYCTKIQLRGPLFAVKFEGNKPIVSKYTDLVDNLIPQL